MKNNKKDEPKMRISGWLPESLYKKVQDLAEGDSRSFNSQMQLLLEYAVREKTRKR